MSGLGPVQIFGENASEERAEAARLASFVGAIAVGDLVKSTYGPKGMDKILQSMGSNDITVTNDGATILKSIALDNAAAKVLVNISKVQDDEVGDGTTSVCILAAELLREGEKLVNQKIHPQTIIEGYRIASAAAFKALEGAAVDNSKDIEVFRKDLINIAKTTLSSKVLSQDKEYFAKLAVDAVLRLKGSTNLDNIQVIKKPGGKLTDSYLAEGFILDKKIGVNQPKRIENAKILVANTPMDTDKIKIFGARVRVDATGKLAELERAEKDKMKEKVEKIKAHGINCFVNRQLIYNWPEQLFADAGIMAIEHADFDGIERLALVTGGEITSTFDHPELVKLGQCDLIEEIIIGEDRLIKFSGVAAGEACTIVLRGATNQLLDEAERSLHDALCVLSQTVQEPRTVLGGGCAEMLMAKAVDEVAVTTSGKRAIAIESFARALRQLPTILADNAGYDSSELVSQLRAAHYEGKSKHGLDMVNGKVADVSVLGITESFKLKRQVLLSASEAAELILRVDDIIRCAPRTLATEPTKGPKSTSKVDASKAETPSSKSKPKNDVSKVETSSSSPSSSASDLPPDNSSSPPNPSPTDAEDAVDIDTLTPPPSDSKSSNPNRPRKARSTPRPQKPTLIKRVLHVRRVSRVTKGGKVRTISALVVVGNGNGSAGYGEGRAADYAYAVQKATKIAERNMSFFHRFDNRTIFKNIDYDYHGVKLELKAATPGFGLVVNPKIYEVCRCIGISDLGGRLRGSRNPLNVVKGTFEALKQQKRPEEIAAARGKKVMDVELTYYGLDGRRRRGV
ncbi:T-complex protein 1 subunit beta [Borealophlyctis nickersoniae]|nr:T-complex protein 1 subunit beta [Borealophlyctis nickersoniae]